MEFTDARRTVALPIRAALPVLTKARNREDLHPSVGLLSGAALLGMRFVAAGKFAPSAPASGAGTPSWRISGLDEDDEERIEMLARAQRDDEQVVRDLIDAVADAMPRQPPAEVPERRPTAPRGPTFEERLQARLAQHRRVDPTDLPQLVRLSIRVEADEEELVAGAVRLVPQVHDEQNPLHLCDLAMLWTHDADEHGFGERARTHATIALRAAADAWPVLDRLLELRVPDQLVLDTDELVSLLDEGVGALRERGVDVLWPRSLGRDLSATATLDRALAGATREEPLNQPLLGTEALFAFRWQVALHGDPLTDAEMDELASSATPLMRLRGNWTVVDPAIVRKARKRLLRTVKPAEAVAAALTGIVQVGTDAATGEDKQEQVIVGASLLKVRDQLLTRRDPRPGRAAGRPDRDPARLPAARPDLARRADLARPRRVPRRRHGSRQDDHPDRAAPAPPRARRRPARRWSCVPRACWATGRTRSTGSPRAPRSSASTAAPATWPAPRTGSCSRRTAPCSATPSGWPPWAGTWSSPTRRSTSRTRVRRPPARCAPSRARRGSR